MSADSEEAAGTPIRVLFVCTANVSRSPYAHHRAVQLYGEYLDVASAGIPGTVGWRMDPSMEARLPYVDRSVLKHRSRRLTSEVLADRDLVLTMEFRHHMRIVESWPRLGHKVFGLRQFVEGMGRAAPAGPASDRLKEAAAVVGPNSVRWDVADPYHRGRRAARRCADELDDLILNLGSVLGFAFPVGR